MTRRHSRLLVLASLVVLLAPLLSPARATRAAMSPETKRIVLAAFARKFPAVKQPLELLAKKLDLAALAASAASRASISSETACSSCSVRMRISSSSCSCIS